MRFLRDCENALGKEIEILKSPYGSVENACRAGGCIRIVKSGFAPCTNYLKKRVRKEWEMQQTESLTYVWGFDSAETSRAERLVEAMPKFEHEFPLIDHDFNKQNVHAICEDAGVKRPVMYDLGYSNNNCIGCVRGGMGYWNKIRVDFPEVFESRMKLERLLGMSCITGVYLDELDPKRGRMSDEILPECGIFCMMAQEDIK